jgi:hypothetical protein
VPADLTKIIQNRPVGISELLREASGLTAAQLRELADEARKLKEKGN